MVSVTQPIGDAFNRMKWILFQPFDLGKWFILGFCAFLAGLGEGGGGNFNTGSGNRGGGGFRASQAVDFVLEHMVIIVILTVAALVLFAAIGALVTWLNSRGKFMFLHCVVTNTAAVRDPWTRFRYLGNNLFWFRFSLHLIFGLASLGVIAFGLFLALPDLKADQFGGGALAAILLVVGFFLFFGLGYGIFMAIVKDFAVPVMYLRNVRARDALGVFRREILPGHLGSLILFYLMKFVLGLAAAMITIVVCCISLCAVAIPYLGSVILLPITVFFQCYTLHFLEQFGPQFQVFERYEPPPAPQVDYTGAY